MNGKELNKFISKKLNNGLEETEMNKIPRTITTSIRKTVICNFYA